MVTALILAPPFLAFFSYPILFTKSNIIRFHQQRIRKRFDCIRRSIEFCGQNLSLYSLVVEKRAREKEKKREVMTENRQILR